MDMRRLEGRGRRDDESWGGGGGQRGEVCRRLTKSGFE